MSSKSSMGRAMLSLRGALIVGAISTFQSGNVQAAYSFPMFFAFESLPFTIIAVSFAVGFVAGILIYPMVRVIRD